MSSTKITELAIKRHDLDASHFQNAYANINNSNQSRRDAVFLYGRKLVLEELSLLLDNLPKGSRILDVGCGTAHLTNWIKGQGFEVYGIEPSKEMFAYATTNFPEIEIKEAISSAIPYPDNYFDLVVAFEVLRYLDKTENEKTYKEFHRVLKKDGQFFVTQVNLYCTDLYFFFHKLKSIFSKITQQTHHHCNFTTAGEQEEQIKKGGFREVNTIGRFSGTVRFFYKFGKGIGASYASFMEKFSRSQRYSSTLAKNMAGHLIVVGKK